MLAAAARVVLGPQVAARRARGRPRAVHATRAEVVDTAGAGDSGSGSQPKKDSLLDRLISDPFSAAVIGPRVALGSATHMLDMLGDLAGLQKNAATASDTLSMFLQDPRPMSDKALELVKDAEGLAQQFEARGIEVEAPARELLRPFIPKELFDTYLDPQTSVPTPAAPPPGWDSPAQAAGAGGGGAAEDAFSQATGAAPPSVPVSAPSAAVQTPPPAPPPPPPPPPPPAPAPPPAAVSQPVFAAAPAAPAPVTAEFIVPDRTPADAWAAASRCSGSWRKDAAASSREDALFDLMEMNFVFRQARGSQAAGFLNELVLADTPTAWSLTSKAGIISIVEAYPKSGAGAPQTRRDLRGGVATGRVVPITTGDVGVELFLEWTGALPGQQTESFVVSEDGNTLLRTVEMTLKSGGRYSGRTIYRRSS